ncbi:hypothetical protein KCU98_g11407, partial [Aureobasidium melanogenum]
MSIPTARPNSLGPTDRPCLDLTDGNSWKEFKEDLHALRKRIDTVLDAQARAMDLGNFANRMVGHTERLSDKHAELDLLGKQVVEMEKCARLINDQSSDEVNKAISVSLSIADKVVKKTKKDIIKIGRLADNVKRDKMVAKTLKSLEVGMLDVTAPILNLPSQLTGLTAAPHAVLGPLLQALQTAHDAAPPALPAPTSLNNPTSMPVTIYQHTTLASQPLMLLNQPKALVNQPSSLLTTLRTRFKQPRSLIATPLTLVIQ